MADLDDFFAKKDRKKSKSVKKFATTDEIAKKLEDTKQQKSDVRTKKERPAQEGDETRRGADEEEWKEYEETVKDYTGLKIQVLQGGTGASGNNASDGSNSEDASQDNGKPKGPWNKPVEAESVAPPPPAPAEERPREAPSKPSAYVPPASRNRPVEPLRRNQTRHAPDIHNADYFPVLGAAGGGVKRAPGAAGGGWSAAGAGGGGGGGGGAPRDAQRQPLALGNRFNALPDDS